MPSKFNPKTFIVKTSKELNKFKNKKILLTISGGVDSSTTAALFKHAGISCDYLMIDSGFLRRNEAQNVKNLLKKSGFNISILNCQKNFYQKLTKAKSPQDKRQIFRKTYFNILQGYLATNNYDFLVQGTQFRSKIVKTGHNNPTTTFKQSKFKLIEPLLGLSKKQIRKVAQLLSLPDEIVNRMPFPGPSLLIRFGGNYTKEKLSTISKATDIIDKFVDSNKKIFKNCFQIFPYLCDCTPVTYINQKQKGNLGQIIIIRAVKEITKKQTKYEPFIIPSQIQQKMVKELMQIPRIGRISFDLTPKFGTGKNVTAGGTIEYQ